MKLNGGTLNMSEFWLEINECDNEFNEFTECNECNNDDQ